MIYPFVKFVNSCVSIRCCIILLFGWIFSFDAIFKLFLTLLLASVTLSVSFERAYTHGTLEDIYERMDALQHHVMVIHTLHVPPVTHKLHLVPAVE